MARSRPWPIDGSARACRARGPERTTAEACKMLTRCAIFEGKIADGREDDFFALVESRLLPLWRQMPNAAAVRLKRPVQHDPDAPPIVMIQEVDYPSMAALEEALASDVRARSRMVTLEILQLFDGRFYHVVCERLAPV